MIHPTYIQKEDTQTLHTLLRQHIKGRVLDVGCGDGGLKKILSSELEYLGMDARPGKGVDVIGDVHALPFKDKSFDSVICTSVLEHVLDINKVTSEMYRVLKPNGKILVTIPFIHHYHKDPEDYWRLSHVGLKKLLSRHGFSRVTTHCNYGVFKVVEYNFFCVLVNARREKFFANKWYLLPYYIFIGILWLVFRILNILTWHIQKHDTSMYVGVAAIAVK